MKAGMAAGVATSATVMVPKVHAHGITVPVTLLVTLMAPAQAAELLEFEFERAAQRYSVTSVAYIDVPPPGVYAVLTDYAQLHRISNLVVASADIGVNEDGDRLVYTLNHGCLAMFCRSLKKVERLQAEPFALIITEALPARSDVAFSHSEWRLKKEGRGTRLEYRLSTDINFWVPPVIGNFVLSRWLKKGATNAVQRIEYFAWHELYSEQGEQKGSARDEAPDGMTSDKESKK